MTNFPLISIITVVLNGKKTIEKTLKSVLEQGYENIEYIIIDGGSTDGTLDIINRYKDKIKKIVSEPDKGIYDAMNKGIAMASGDIIGILNGDDLYADGNVIKKVVEKMEEDKADVCWGDLIYVNANNSDKIVRYWKSSEYKEGKFQKGWMPPHSTFFVKKQIYKKYGVFNLDFPISADYELMLRFLEKYKLKSCYMSQVLVKMRIGGQSNKNLLNIVKGNVECYKAYKINGLKISFLRIFLKPLSKISQYFKK
ncbi:MAG: glycosyltransferase [Candidatus Nealsonbacteria bacterium]|nr:MAG: glycosyltransferase [Candidatus Nealsonbacteria bacterium]